MKHIIHIDTWERKDNYNFFRGFANSWIAVTSEADCTEAYARAKERRHSFFLYYLYAIVRAVNEIKELRYRWDKNGQVVLHDTVDVITPIAVPGRTFYTVRIPYHPDFDTFYREARRIITSIPEDGGSAGMLPDAFPSSPPSLPSVTFSHPDNSESERQRKRNCKDFLIQEKRYCLLLIPFHLNRKSYAR